MTGSVRGVAHAAALLLSAVWLGACSIPHPAEAGTPTRPINRALLAASAVRVEVLAVNEARIPERALERALATFGRSLGAEIEVVDHGRVTLPTAPGSRMLSEPLSWPITDGGRLVAAEEIMGMRGPYIVSGPGPRGVLGAMAVLGHDGREGVLPIAGAETILVAVVHREPRARFVTGYYRGLFSPGFLDPSADAERLLEPGGGLIVLQQEVIESRSGVFVDQEKLWEWTLVHELGHHLGVPSDPSHARSSGGPHCTEPTCVMYSPGDWRMVLANILRGWPLDYCHLCRAEIEAARE